MGIRQTTATGCVQMRTQEFLFKGIAWITAKHLMHYQKHIELLSSIAGLLMKLFAPALFEHAEASINQGAELHELKVLGACYEMKRAAHLAGGWSEQHGYGLDQIAHVLVTQHGWDPEDVGDFVEDLTEGHFMFASFDDDE